jgi:hypothetical protein
MVETLDQMFVLLKQWLVGFVPAVAQPYVSALISVAAIIIVFASLFALTTIVERKGLGRIQNRYGPNRVGPFGLLQPAADGLKALFKEDIVPRAADKVVHFLAPIVVVVPAGGVFCPSDGTWCWWISTPGCSSFLPWVPRRNCPSSWPAGRVGTNIRCSAPCARSRR